MEVVRVGAHDALSPGTIGRDELAKRADDITKGRWLGLVEAIISLMREPQCRTIQEDSNSSREDGGCSKLRAGFNKGQVSRARQALVGAALAPGNNATLEELQRRHLQVVLSEIPPEMLTATQNQFWCWTGSSSRSVCRRPRQAASQGQGVARMKCCGCAWTTLNSCNCLQPRPKISPEARPHRACRTCSRWRMTALQKKDGGVWDRHRDHFQTFGGENIRTAIQQGRRSRVRTFSIRVVNEGRCRIAWVTPSEPQLMAIRS